MIGKRVCVAVAAHQTLLSGGKTLQPGQLAKVEEILPIVSGPDVGQKFAVLSWSDIDGNPFRVAVYMRDVREVSI